MNDLRVHKAAKKRRAIQISDDRGGSTVTTHRASFLRLFFPLPPPFPFPFPLPLFHGLHGFNSTPNRTWMYPWTPILARASCMNGMSPMIGVIHWGLLVLVTALASWPSLGPSPFGKLSPLASAFQSGLGMGKKRPPPVPRNIPASGHRRLHATMASSRCEPSRSFAAGRPVNPSVPRYRWGPFFPIPRPLWKADAKGESFPKGEGPKEGHEAPSAWTFFARRSHVHFSPPPHNWYVPYVVYSPPIGVIARKNVRT